ncbi:MAG: hypothetical protein ACPGXL_02465 [Chitinophagales bacterium]
MLTVSAQEVNKKIKLSITDNNGGIVNQLDTVVLAHTNIESLLQQLGFDQASIEADPASKSGRSIQVHTEEILEVSTAGTPSFSPKTGRSLGVTRIKVEDILDIPPDAIVIDVPEGKKIIKNVYDAQGNVVDKEETIVRVVDSGRIEHNGSSSTQWSEMSDNQGTKVGVASMYNPSMHSAPKVKISVADLDRFDQHTLNSKDPALLETTPMAVEQFKVDADYQSSNYRLAFQLPSGASSARLRIFDVVGGLVHEEIVEGGAYNKALENFSIYHEGTYLILVQTEGQQFSRKVSFEKM